MTKKRKLYAVNEAPLSLMERAKAPALVLWAVLSGPAIGSTVIGVARLMMWLATLGFSTCAVAWIVVGILVADELGA